MKIQYILYLLMISSFCACSNEDKQFRMNSINVKSTIKRDIDSVLYDGECLPIKITKSGFSNLSDSLHSDMFVKANSTLVGLHKFEKSGDTVWAVDNMKLCFAYRKRDTVCISFYNPNLDNYLMPLLNISICKDSFQSNFYRLSENKILARAVTIYQELTLDKNSYQVGDTIQGYVDFRGYLKTKSKRDENYKGYFKTIIGKSSHPKDCVGAFESCEQPSPIRKLPYPVSAGSFESPASTRSF
jgi:hypothetical protein